MMLQSLVALLCGVQFIISNDITTEGYCTVRTHTNNLICVRTWGYYASANGEVYILPVTSE